MKILGLITEYNPFHYGHQFHLEQSKKITGADFVIVVMSGNFVQRGTPALIDKYTRTKMALNAGADLVIELPVCFATSSAEYFAMGAVSLLEQLGIVDCICFGSEIGNIQPLTQIAKILINEPEQFKTNLNALLKTGMTYPAARSNALLSCLHSSWEKERFRTILNSPNNILGIEYIKALLKLKSSITPFTIPRNLASYHDQSLTEKICSATAIRLSISQKQPLVNIKPHVPPYVYSLLLQAYENTFPIFEKDYSLLLQYKLLLDSNCCSNYLDVTKDLAMRIQNLPFTNCSLEDFALHLKTKQVTLSRVNRALLHILLNITSQKTNAYCENGYTQYIRILGIRKKSSFLLKKVKNLSSLPIITKTADAKRNLSPFALIMLEEDIYASHIYNSVIYNKFNTAVKNEYTHGIILF